MMFANSIVTAKGVQGGVDVSCPTTLRLFGQWSGTAFLSRLAGARGHRRYVAREIMGIVTGDLDG